MPAIIYTVLILTLFSVFIGLSQCSSQEEKAFSDSCAAGDVVFADIATILPLQYFAPAGGGHGAYLCQAETADKETLWLYISKDNYTQFMDPYVTEPYEQIRFSQPLRIYGDVIKAENVAEGLSQVTGALVVEFTYAE